VGLTAGLAVLVWAAARTGSIPLMTDSGRTFVFHAPSLSVPQHHHHQPKQQNLKQLTAGVHQTLDLSWLGTLIGWAIVIGFCIAGLFLIRYVWRNTWRPPEAPVEVDFDVLPEGAVSEAIREDAAAQIDAVAYGSPRDGIVRCWLRLEESIASAGLKIDPTETSAEFTVRVLRALDIDPRAIGTLARLYREARFSDHHLDESARAAARAALEQLHADLRTLPAGVA
jgi:hypothetical protein